MINEARELLGLLHEIMGVQRKLLDLLAQERESVAGADIKALEEVTVHKQAYLGDLAEFESQRQLIVGRIALELKIPVAELTLKKIIEAVQATDLKLADLMRATLNALVVITERMTDKNLYNKELLEKSLEHIQAMKRNVLGEQSPQSNTYSRQGQKVSQSAESRLLSKEI